MAHRRFGKTVFCINQLIAECLIKRLPDARYAYIAPYRHQAEDVAWSELKKYTEVIPGIKYNNSKLRIDFPWGSRISLYGADNPDALRGLGLHGAVVDEYAQIKDELWGSVLRPMLTDHHGFAIFIGTPSPEGLDNFYRLYNSHIDDPEWYTALHKASETGVISDEELESIRKDPETSREQYQREYEVAFHIPSALGFDRAWLNYWDNRHWVNLNRYILVDPANEKKKKSDYTAIVVVGRGEDDNFYLIDMVRDRLNLTERTDTLLQLHRKYRPLGVIYEKYGIQSDIQHIEFVQAQENYRFVITPAGGMTNKQDRIRGLAPIFQHNRMFIPYSILIPTDTGIMRDLTKEFEEEYLSFPNGLHDDMMDCLARITEVEFNKTSKAPIDRELRYRPAWAEGANPNPPGRINRMRQRPAFGQ